MVVAAGFYRNPVRPAPVQSLGCRAGTQVRAMLTVSPNTDPDWLAKTREAIRHRVRGGDRRADCGSHRADARRDVQDSGGIRKDVGQERLTGRARSACQADAALRHVLSGAVELPEMLAVVDETVSETAILHLQNGFILPPQENSVARSFPAHLPPRLPSAPARLLGVPERHAHPR